MNRMHLRIGLGVLAAVVLSGCVVKETRPLPQLQAVQASAEIAEDKLLDVGIRVFDPGIPEAALEDPEKADELRVYPDIRRAEARYMATRLRETLAGTGQWGVVRVVPTLVDATDLSVDGRIESSDGAQLRLAIRAVDATGRVWLEKSYEGTADTRSYREGGNLGRDPFQNVYVNIANDLLAARQALGAAQTLEVQRVADLRFAGEFAPEAFGGYLAFDKKSGRYRVARLPAADDPMLQRVERIRDRDANLVDAVSDSYASFSERMDEPYSNWRRYTYDEIQSEEKLKAQARNRIAMGAIAVAASILVPDNCSGSTCARVVDAARYGAAAGGVMAVMSGIKKREEAKMHTDALKELSNSFESEAAPLVVEVEGRTLRLTGTADEQYAEWRKLLQELYREEVGLPPAEPAAVPGPG